MRALNKAGAVTVERLEGALDCLAEVMVEMGNDGAVYLPIYERLERELAEMRSAQDKMTAIRERAKAARSRRRPK